MQTIDVQGKTFTQTRPAAAARTTAASRLAYIDMIRVVMTIMVIMVHAAVTYGSLGDWTYEDPAATDELTGILLSLFVIISQSFFMGLFFFYAGYFTPGALDRKGLGSYWKDRLLRLAIPLLAYTLVLSRVPNYINAVANDGVRSSFWQYSLRTFWNDADGGPTWFLFALLVFCAVYTLWRLASRFIDPDRLAWTSRLPVPGTKTLLALGLVISASMFVIAQTVMPIPDDYRLFGAISVRVGFFPGYILLFIGGILAYRNNWLARLEGKSLRFWAVFSAVLVLALPALLILGGAADGYFDQFMSGTSWRCILTSLWMGMAAVTFSMALTLWLRGRVKPQSRLAAFAGPNTFAVYLIHPLVLVPICYGLSFHALHPIVKFGLASLGTVIACFILAEGLRRLPGLKSVL